MCKETLKKEKNYPRTKFVMLVIYALFFFLHKSELTIRLFLPFYVLKFNFFRSA